MRLMTEQLKSETAHSQTIQQRMSLVGAASGPHPGGDGAFIGGKPIFSSLGTAGLPDDALVFTMEQ